jgi:hypothetical protein
MNKKLGILLLVNIPFCACLYLLFCYIAVRSGYAASHGYGLIVWQLFLFFFILNLVISLTILKLIKLLSTKPEAIATKEGRDNPGREAPDYFVFMLISAGVMPYFCLKEV